MAHIIEQTHYRELEIDNTEKDCVQIWQAGVDPQLIFIDRETLPQLIAHLQTLVKE